MIKKAEDDGIIQAGVTIIEPTSGNIGIGLAMNAAAKGYRAVMVMPDNSIQERRNILRAYGAEVVLTPIAERMPGAIKNHANLDIHRTTTVLEIYEQMEGEMDAFVATSGTGGTITGTGEPLKDKIPTLFHCQK